MALLGHRPRAAVWSHGAAALLALVVLVTAFAPAAARAPACAGRNLLVELERSEPDLHRRLLTEAAGVANGEAMLWRIEKDGVEPSHLLGTMHVTDPRIATLSPAVEQSIRSARVVALELADLSPDSMAKAMERLAKHLVYVDGRRLDTQLAPGEFDQALKILQGSGMPPQIAAVIRPWFVYMLLAVPDCERRRIAAGVEVLDARVASIARKAGVKVIGLETVESQTRVLAGLPEDQQLAMLRAAIKYADRRDDLLETLIAMYRERRLALAMPLQIALAEKAGERRESFAAFEADLVVKRNIGMRDKALPLLAKGRALIAVGALHLVGEQGLVALLREAGYRVTAVE